MSPCFIFLICICLIAHMNAFYLFSKESKAHKRSFLSSAINQGVPIFQLPLNKKVSSASHEISWNLEITFELTRLQLGHQKL